MVLTLTAIVSFWHKISGIIIKYLDTNTWIKAKLETNCFREFSVFTIILFVIMYMSLDILVNFSCSDFTNPCCLY